MLVKRVLDTIKRHNLIGQGENVVVGVSGGPDSVCLLHVLFSLSRQLQMKLYAVHINHMLRGNEANADERYVEDLCKNLGLGLHTKACDINGISKDEGISLEEAGRNARYREFEEFADSIGGARIAVAHNKKDQAETVLMNIVRGTGLHGLKGMDYSRGRIVRPLLDIERKDIEVYCSLHSLEPRTDATNLLEIYTRNKIRLGLIPYIDRAFDTNLVESLTRMSDLLRDENDFIERTAADFYDRCKVTCTGSVVALDIGKLNAMHIAMIKRVIRCGIKDVKGDLKGIESVHVDDVLKIGLSGNTGSEIHLPGGIRAVNSYGLLKIYIKEENISAQNYRYVLTIPGTTHIIEFGAKVCSRIEEKAAGEPWKNMVPQDSQVQFFDYDKLKTGINIRSRLEGDIFKPYNSNGTKKLKKYLIDKKIPKEERGNIPIITKDNEVVWLVGYKISDKFKVTENTKCILRLEYKADNKS